MADATPTLTAADMLAMLRRHYLPEGRPPGGVFAPEIQSPCGRRRADLIWLSTTIAGGRHMIGHEVKVSRSDVISELNDPTKADPWAQYCNEWWLVISDPKLIDGLDIPDAWGIMSPPSGRRTRSMTVLRKAPKLNPSEAAAGVARLTAWLNQKLFDVENRHAAELRSRDWQIMRQETEIENLRAGGARNPSPHAKRLNDLSRRVEKALREKKVWGAQPTDDELVAALVDLSMVQDRAREIARSINGLRTGVERAAKAIAEMPNVDPTSQLPIQFTDGAA